MARQAVYMPKLGMTMTEGLIAEWLVKVGDTVAVGDEIVTIETEKVETILDADDAGVIVELIAAEKEEVGVGKVIAYIETGDAT